LSWDRDSGGAYRSCSWRLASSCLLIARMWISKHTCTKRPKRCDSNLSRSASPSLLRSAIRRGIEKAVRLETHRAPANSRIEIPRIGLSAVVVEGVDSGDLAIAVGHVPGTAAPGEGGNVVLAGHRDTFFRQLREIRRGDAIRLATPKTSYRYSVELVEVVEPSYVQALQTSSYPKLTLITCYPFSFVGACAKEIHRAGAAGRVGNRRQPATDRQT
jgi:LPXTG-site transpeptidase (sortase) family protein